MQRDLEQALVFHRQGDLAQAERLYRAVLAQAPAHLPALVNLGMIAMQTGNFPAAAQWFDRALAVKPDDAHVLANRGAALQRLGRHQEALASFDRALGFGHRDATVHCNRGNVLRALRRPDEALASFEAALAADGAHVHALFSRGLALCETGSMDEGMASLRACLALRPAHAAAHAALVFALLRTTSGGAAVYEQCSRFAESIERGIVWPRHGNSADPHRRLRVGYVSGDFRDHSVARFVEPVLKSHDRERFEVFCYSNHRTVDAMTRHLMQYADHWREIHALSDERACDLVREDGIDILVDLSGHTSFNRLPLFARKPAPVQVTRVGVPCTTGLRAMDYRMTNVYADPPGLTERHHSETVVRLPMSSCCLPEPDLPPVGALPALAKGHVTFASFNQFNKVTPAVCALWSRILTALPGARLALVCDAGSRERAARMFEGHGIGGERLQLVGNRPLREYLASHAEVDIALDPFPYNGGTITRNSLWMGVPVVALTGTTSVSRFGYALMTQVGLDAFVARDADEYVRIAVRWARDLEGLAEVRRTLRERMRDAPFNDGLAYTRAIETEYRRMWHAWCVGRAVEQR